MTSTEKTLRHIKRVQDLLGEVACELVRRGSVHDASKFDEAEAGPLTKMDEIVAREGNVPFGSPEYEARKQLLGPMLAHHYASNTHHPEHYPNGVGGMDLFDVVEMFVDWKAASERGEQSSMSLKVAAEKYGLSDQLHQIMRNTAERLQWPTDQA